MNRGSRILGRIIDSSVAFLGGSARRFEPYGDVSAALPTAHVAQAQRSTASGPGHSLLRHTEGGLMITKLNHVNVFVLDQDRAKQFYTETLGLDVRNDSVLDGFRWLTVGPKD